MSESDVNREQSAQPELLSSQLKSATQDVHDQAENSDFMARLLAGKLDVAAAIDFTAQLWFVYSALESAARATSETSEMSAIFDPRLERVEKLEADLAAMCEGSDVPWRERLVATPETEEYAARLRSLGEEGDGAALVAHHYVRYLGDMAGGQVIAAMFKKHYGLNDDAVTFYNFDELGKIKPYRDQYREKLDSIQLDQQTRAHILDEAVKAFQLNTAMFASLQN